MPSLSKLFNRPQTDQTVRWDADAKLIKTIKRLADLEALLHDLDVRLADHDRLIDEAAKHLDRAELDVLAGRGSDSVLADKQAAHLAARRAKALDQIAREDALEEQAKLQAALPGIERAAKQASQASIRAKYLAAARDLLAALEAVRDADARLTAIQQDAVEQFPGRSDLAIDASMPVAAGCPLIGRTVFNADSRLMQYIRPTGHANQWLAQVGNTVDALEKLQAALDS